MKPAAFLALLLPALTLLTVACGEPIVPRGPAQLYQLAQEQIKNQHYVRAADTLGGIARRSQDPNYAVKAGLIQLAILAGLGRAALALGEVYREASERTEPGPYHDELRTAALNHFNLGQSWALALLEAVDAQTPRWKGNSLPLDSLLPSVPPPRRPALGVLRSGGRIPEAERSAVEREAVQRGLAEVMSALAGAPGDFGRAPEARAQGSVFLPAATVFLVFANELVHLSTLFAPQALDNLRYHRLFHERGLALAERALALTGDATRREEAQRLVERCRRVLAPG